MCIKIKLNKSSKCRHCVGILGSNPDSSPVVSQSHINNNERSVVKGSAGMMGRRKETSFPLSPSHRPLRTSTVIVSRNRSLTAYKIIRDDCGRFSGQIKLEPHPIEGLNSNFPTVRAQEPITVSLLRQFVPRKSIFLDQQRYSALLLKLHETAFFFGDKYCCYVSLALNRTVSSLISRIKTIGRGC